MNDFVKRNITTLMIAGATVFLAGIAIFTALRLFQLRNQSVAPNAPASTPAAATSIACQALTFTIATATTTPSPTAGTARLSSANATATLTRSPSPTPTRSPSPTPTKSPTPTPLGVGGLSSTPSPTPTLSPSPLAKATNTSTPRPTAASLPVAGDNTPTFISMGAAMILIFGAAILFIL